MTDDLPTPAEIIAAHDRIEAIYDLKYTGTMAATPKRTLRREVIEPAAACDDPSHRAATVLWKIESAHVFEDANKRTAWAVTENHLQENEIESPSDDELVARVVRRAGKFDVDELADWFETGDIDESRLPEINSGPRHYYQYTAMSQQKERDTDDLDGYKDRIERTVEKRRELFDRLA